ncbi:hypothetical protein H6P81_011682 [Aristolochia fimbriata]|uniref:Transferrin-like domain-containing protein n=1 Tax=Aristolochia fimbriata TaxID=158543 RepID=A0AAV7EBA7_ARIFI|nr:hypothetical protein H6P81_011682 [Aristolochia fimbriata]
MRIISITVFFIVFLPQLLSLRASTTVLHGSGPAPAPPQSRSEFETDDIFGEQHSIAIPPVSAVEYSDTPSPSPERDGGADAYDHVDAPAPPIDEGSAAVPPGNPAATEEDTHLMMRWCAVRDEFEDCLHYVTLLGRTHDPYGSYHWTCIRRETTEECLHSIKEGEAEMINLEAGLGYIAFLNYSMKAIANEVYHNQAEGYEAVAVVNREVCQDNPEITLKDFQGSRSCHGGYWTATGWNYPIYHLKDLVDKSKQLNDRGVISEFFSAVCAPSDFNSMGDCSGCANENGSCSIDSIYRGHAGAFRCLLDELGDIAFVKGDTPLLYSKEGPYKKAWSTKSVREFMYLCPQGGCREINGYPGDCILGTVPANAIMVHNSVSGKKRSQVLQTLLHGNWADALYTGKNTESHLLSSR